MRKNFSILFAIVFSMAIVFGPTASASEDHDAKKLCKHKITEVYGVNQLSDLLTDQVGNHKFKIQGKVRVSNHKYQDIGCRSKN